MEISVRVCILDGTPPQESDCYRTLCEIMGEQKASRWVEEVSVCLNHPPPEVLANDRFSTLVMGSQRGYQSSSIIRIRGEESITVDPEKVASGS